MFYTYQFRLYPDQYQQARITRALGCVRFIYNHYLSMRLSSLEATGAMPSPDAESSELKRLLQEKPWLREVDITTLQDAVRRLDYSFRDCMRHGHYPRYKAKKHVYRRLSFRVNCSACLLDDGYITIPRLGRVKARGLRPVQGDVMHMIVCVTRSGKYKVSVICSVPTPEPLPLTGAAVGIDLGVRRLAVTSDGETVPNPRFHAAASRKLLKLHRKLLRKPSRSKRAEKLSLRIARISEHVTNQRRDMIYKLALDLVRRYDVCAIEDIAVSDFQMGRAFSVAVQDTALGLFQRLLERKAAWYGKTVVRVSRWYPSSQLCSVCGSRFPELKDPGIQSWTCPVCGTAHDRDINAAINIYNEGLRLLA